MHMTMARASVIAIAFAVLPSLASAQKLQTGTWTGTVTPPDNPTVDVVFEVTEANDTVHIVVKVADIGDFPFSDITVHADRLTFRFEPGTPVSCTLMLKENGSYSGDCLDSDGDVGVIVMNPPAKMEPFEERRPSESGRTGLR